MSETPDSDYTDVSVPDEDLPEDLQTGRGQPAGRAADRRRRSTGPGRPAHRRPRTRRRRQPGPPRAADADASDDAHHGAPDSDELTGASYRIGPPAAPSVGRCPPRSTQRYGSDVLASDWRAPKNGRAVPAVAESGAVVEEVMTDFCGEIVAVDRDLDTLTLEDRRGKRRTFPLGPGFLLEGRPVILSAPVRQGPARADAYGVRVGRRARRPGAGRPGQPHLRRGPPRRRAGREGVGRRPAARGRGRGVPRRRRRPGRSPARLRAPGRSAASACWSTTWSPAPRRAGSPRRSAVPPSGEHVLVVGPSVRGRLGRGEARPARARPLARRAALGGVEEGRVPPPRLAATHAGGHRPRLEADPGGCRRTPTSSPPCSAGSRSSSTS